MKRAAPPVAVLRWKGELWEKPTAVPHRISGDDDEQLMYEWSYPLAKALNDALHEREFASAPYEGEGGWTCCLSIEGRPVRAFVNWTPLEGPPHDRFAVQWWVARSFGQWLFRRQPPPEVSTRIRDVLDRELRSIPQVADLMWLTDEQFEASYCRGEPLPRSSVAGGDAASKR